MGVEVEESSEFRLANALFWYELDDSHMIWFSDQDGELVAQTYSKDGIQVGSDVGFGASHDPYVVRHLDDGNYLICSRTHSEEMDDETGTFLWTTSYEIYSPSGNLLSREQVFRQDWSYVNKGYYELSNGSHVEVALAWGFTSDGDVLFSIFDEVGQSVAVEVTLEEDPQWAGGFVDLVPLSGGKFAIFSTLYNRTTPSTAYQHQFQLFGADGKALTQPITMIEGYGYSKLHDCEINGDGNLMVLSTFEYVDQDDSMLSYESLTFSMFDQSGNELSSFQLPKMLENTPSNPYKISEPHITLLEDGGWVVSWFEGFQFKEGFADGFFSQTFGADGQPVGQTQTLHERHERWGDLIYPGHDITALHDGGYVATWYEIDMDARDPLGGVWMQQAFDADGSALTKSFKVTDFKHQSYILSVEALSDGGWRNTFNDGQEQKFHTSDFDTAAIAYDFNFHVAEKISTGMNTFTFLCFDQDGDRISGIEFVTVPEYGAITYNGKVLEAGDIVSWSDFAGYGESNTNFFYTPPTGIIGDGVDDFYFRAVMDNGTMSNVANITVSVSDVFDPPTSQDFEITVKEDSRISLKSELFSYRANEGGDLAWIVTESAYKKDGSFGRWTDYLEPDDLKKIPFRLQDNEFGEACSEIRYRLLDDEGNSSDWYEITVNVTEVMDTFNGTKRRDMMTGIEGSNRLFGENGNDRFRAGEYDDIYIGGKGRDTFEFVAGGGNDRVKDFTKGQDIIDVSALLDVDSLKSLRGHISHADGDTIIHFGGRDDDDNTLTIDDVRLKDLDNRDFEF